MLILWMDGQDDSRGMLKVRWAEGAAEEEEKC